MILGNEQGQLAARRPARNLLERKPIHVIGNPLSFKDLKMIRMHLGHSQATSKECECGVSCFT
jgi:hypothetical protein